MTLAAASAHGPSVLWYVTRGAGAMTLVLLTVSVAFGVAEARLWRPAASSRFAVASVHRAVSLLALTLLTVHVASTLFDPFPRITVLAAVVPFASGYRRLWLGLGTLACDLLLAVTVTSLVRRRLGYRVWRGVHWAAYACWPVAVAHGLGTGSDAASAWMLALTVLCVGAVVIVVAGRLAARGLPARVRVSGALGLTAAVTALAVWLPAGPLGPGWARRAGTPASVLAAFSPRPRAPAARRAGAHPLPRAFSTTFTGRVSKGTSAGGTAVADLSLRLARPDDVLRVRLGGRALDGGGLALRRSAVTLGSTRDPARYRGRVDTLQGSQLTALVATRSGAALRLTVDLSLGADTASGTVQGVPVRAARP